MIISDNLLKIIFWIFVSGLSICLFYKVIECCLFDFLISDFNIKEVYEPEEESNNE